MAECKTCVHEKVCKYKDEKISIGITVGEITHECKDYKTTSDAGVVKREEMVEFGSYLRYESGEEEEAKKLLKRQLHGVIDFLCEDEDFWIRNDSDYRGGDLFKQKDTIAWKIAVPHMEPKDWINKKSGEEDGK